MMSPDSDLTSLRRIQVDYEELLGWMKRIADGWHLKTCPQIDYCLCSRAIAQLATMQEGFYLSTLKRNAVKPFDRDPSLPVDKP